MRTLQMFHISADTSKTLTVLPDTTLLLPAKPQLILIKMWKRYLKTKSFTYIRSNGQGLQQNWRMKWQYPPAKPLEMQIPAKLCIFISCWLILLIINSVLSPSSFVFKINKRHRAEQRRQENQHSYFVAANQIIICIQKFITAFWQCLFKNVLS